MLSIPSWRQPIPTNLEIIFKDDHRCNILYRELIYRACNQDGFFTTPHGLTVPIKRGQVVFGRRAYAAYLGWDDGKKVERALQKLEKVYHLLSLSPTHTYTLVTLTDYDGIIKFVPGNIPQVSQSCPTDVPPLSTSKSVKSVRVKDCKNNINTFSDNEEYLQFWNSLNIIVHKQLTSSMTRAIQKAETEFSKEDIKHGMQMYADIVLDPSIFFKHKWTMEEFLTRSNGLRVFIYKTPADYKQQPSLNLPSSLDLRIQEFQKRLNRQPTPEEIEILKTKI